MRLQAQAVDFLHFEFDVSVNHVVAHHPAGGQELAVGVQRVQRDVEAVRHRRQLLLLFRRQVVEVFVGRVAGVNLVVDAVQAGHQHRGESEIRIARGVGEANLDAPRFGVGHIRNAARSGAVARRVRQQNRRFKTRHQAFVTVGAGVGEGVDGARVFENAADVVQRGFAQAAVLVAGENVRAAFENRLVDMHAGAVVADQWLGHKSRGEAVVVRDIVDDILQDLHLVGFGHQGVELRADFALPRGADFVVVHFRFHAHLGQHQTHQRPHISLAVDRRHREVTALDPGPVAGVAFLVFLAAVPRRFGGVDFIKRVAHLVRPGDRVEQKELVLGAEIRGLADAAGGEIGLGALGDGARVAAVALHGGRLDDVATQVDRGFLVERVQHRGAGVRHENHVGLVDAFPAGDGGAVEHLALLEGGLVHGRGRDRDMLLLAAGVGESKIDKLGFAVFDEFQGV